MMRILTLLGILVWGETSLLAEESKVNVNKNKKNNIIHKSKIIGSSMGIKDVRCKKQDDKCGRNLSLVLKSKVLNSNVPMDITAK